MTWEARFSGRYATLKVNGVAQAARTRAVNGLTVSYVRVVVPVGLTVTVETSAAKFFHATSQTPDLDRVNV
jgi:hypothetical protein